MNTTSTRVLICLVVGASLVSVHREAADATTIPGVLPASVAGGVREADRLARPVQAAGGSDGWYTASQAERGKRAYDESCSSCHGPSLRGGANEFAAPPLAGPFFYEKWIGRTVDELFRYAAENMPPDQMKLTEAAYLDVTAYVLQVLKYPAGTAELTASSSAMKRLIEQPR
jgi:mono/diheme cytochrome c family protein